MRAFERHAPIMFVCNVLCFVVHQSELSTNQRIKCVLHTHFTYTKNFDDQIPLHRLDISSLFSTMSDIFTNSQDSLGDSLFEGSLAPNDSISTVPHTLGFDNTSNTSYRHPVDFVLVIADTMEAHERLKDHPVYPR